MSASPAETAAVLADAAREAWAAGMPAAEVEALYRSWRFWARPEQLPPEWLWRWWLVKTGRGYGKNRMGSEWVCDRAERFAAARHRHMLLLLNRTFNAVNALQIRGDSGLGVVCERRGHRLHHAPTSLEGAIEVWDEGWQRTEFEVHTADDPDRVRGRNAHTIHADEMAAWRHKVDSEGGTAFSNADLGLRLPCPAGLVPQGLVTTTPKPILLLRQLIAGGFGPTAVTHGSLYENLANLAPSFIAAVLGRYSGTRLGAQEIDGLMLEDVEGALWKAAVIEQHRRQLAEPHSRRVVGVDPPGGLHTECGIVVAGRHRAMDDPHRPHADLLEDYSHAGPPERWGRTVVEAYRKWGCQAAVAEVNYGGEMVRSTIHAVDPTVTVEMVRATRGKKLRAEPVAVHYDGGRVHHVGVFGDLEAEMTTWVDEPGVPSPNRLDAMVWAMTDLLPTDEIGPAVGWSPAEETGAAYVSRARAR